MAVGALPRIQHAASHDESSGHAAPDAGVTTRLRALRTRAEPATPVEAAAALIELSLHESNGPVEELSGALVRMAQLVRGAPGGNTGTADHQSHHAQLAREFAVCVENLQFHDRLTQQLTQVRNLLATLAFSAVPTDLAGRPLEGDPHNWQLLLENLRARFTSDSHRILFNLLLPGSARRTSVPALHANEGSVELF
ncbi:MAG: hypothetical protein ACRETD_03855 [Steroidobacteraceae bacterium]